MGPSVSPCPRSKANASSLKFVHHAKFVKTTAATMTSRNGSSSQGLTLVRFSAQRKHFLWDRGCKEGVCRGCVGGVLGNEGVYFVSETAEVELKSGRV
jgi:hypothetical protein